jgi:hypothetical protein
MAENRATPAAREYESRSAHLHSPNPASSGPADTAYQIPIGQ